ncbi:hypothetical protein TrVE_jg12310 [Triparma verrucosa]|uniref:Cytochrome P450 n=1 Tax=Triparma verrucosa TaxID=1606542 RepID=A0A9W7CBI4_9STRA|nr:hypothetical protein TrVE_jg12310 [Triparma verrucosa]
MLLTLLFNPFYPILQLLSYTNSKTQYYCNTIWYSCVLLKAVWLLKRNRVKGLPYPSNSLPFFGHALLFTKETPWNLMSHWHTLHGPTYSFTLLSRPCISTSSPPLLHQILHKSHSKFDKDIHFTYFPFLTILGSGIVTSSSTRWRKKRLTYSKIMRITILPTIPSTTLSSYSHFTRFETDTIDFNVIYRNMTLSIISSILLSLEPIECIDNFGRLYLPVMEECNRRVWDPTRRFIVNGSWWKFYREGKELNRYVTDLVKRRVEEREKGGYVDADILDYMLTGGGVEVGVQDVVDEVKTFVLAGHETTASMLAWCTAEVGRDERVREKLREEAEKVWNQEEKDFTKLNYAEMCLRETLRLHSVVPTVTRSVEEDFEFEGIMYERGTTVMVGIQAAHMDERNWKDPKTFKPERFSNFDDVKPYTFLPFIDGPRNCLGQYIAMLEAKIIISKIFWEYDLEVVEGGKEKDGFMVPVVPKDGVKCKWKRRN